MWNNTLEYILCPVPGIFVTVYFTRWNLTFFVVHGVILFAYWACFTTEFSALLLHFFNPSKFLYGTFFINIFCWKHVLILLLHLSQLQSTTTNCTTLLDAAPVRLPSLTVSFLDTMPKQTGTGIIYFLPSLNPSLVIFDFFISCKIRKVLAH